MLHFTLHGITYRLSEQDLIAYQAAETTAERQKVLGRAPIVAHVAARKVA